MINLFSTEVHNHRFCHLTQHALGCSRYLFNLKQLDSKLQTKMMKLVAIVAVVFGVAVVIGGVVNVVVNDVVKGRFFATRRSIGRQELTF